MTKSEVIEIINIVGYKIRDLKLLSGVTFGTPITDEDYPIVKEIMHFLFDYMPNFKRGIDWIVDNPHELPQRVYTDIGCLESDAGLVIDKMRTCDNNEIALCTMNAVAPILNNIRFLRHYGNVKIPGNKISEKESKGICFLAADKQCLMEDINQWLSKIDKSKIGHGVRAYLPIKYLTVHKLIVRPSYPQVIGSFPVFGSLIKESTYKNHMGKRDMTHEEEQECYNAFEKYIQQESKKQ